MTANEVDPILQQLIAAHKVGQSEKKSFGHWLTSHAPAEQDRAFVRSRAFLMAREATHDSEAKQLMEWLEDVIKLTVKPAVEAGHAGHSEAFFSPGTDCTNAVIHQFHSARKSADVCVFTITDDRITAAILQSHRAGVKIRIISDDEKSHDLGSDIEQLKNAGIPCVIDDSPEAHMHHKFAIFDGSRLLTGSFNWTRSAGEINEENLIVTPDATLISAFQQRFDRLWARWGKE